MKILLGLMFFSLFPFHQASAFVENTVHGYPSCIACHVAPNGGGLLTDYGRSLSKELMSTWGISDSFARPFFGVKNRDTVKFGGDIMTAQTYIENNNIDRGEFFVMQQNIEVGVKVDKVMFIATAGTQEGPEATPDRGQFLSERHYALWSPTQTSRIQIGKYRQSFGINTPNHTRLIKNTFGFGSLSETYNLEYTQFYETYEVKFGSSLGRIDQPRNATTEQNISSHYTYYLNENSRIGGSILMGESTARRRFLSSINGILPISKNWLSLFEINYEQSQFAASPQDNVDTLASLFRIGYSPAKGLLWYFVFEHASVDDPATNYSLIHQPGLGVQWLPVPHINIQLEYLRQISSAAPGNPSNIGFLVFHTYL